MIGWKMKTTLFVFMLLFLLCTCSSKPSSNSGDSDQENEGATGKVEPVRIATEKTESLYQVVEASGVITSDRDVILISETSGQIVSLKFDLGQKVKKGDVLLSVDPEPYQIQVKQAKAQHAQSSAALKQAELEFNRIEQLFNSKDVSESQFDQAKLALAQAQAANTATQAGLQQAERALRKSSIRAPFAGEIASKLVKFGDTVAPATPVAQIVDRSKLKVQVGVGEDVIGLLRTGRKASLNIQSQQGEPITATVTSIGVKALKPTMSYPVELTIDNSVEDLRIGMAVRVSIPIGEPIEGVFFPIELLIERFDRYYVFVVEDGTAHEREVKLGPKIGKRVLLKEGVKDGDSLVISGQHNLSDQSSVQVVE